MRTAKDIKILVACEFSGVVREAFRSRGFDAWSCDILETELAGPHYKCDVRDVLNNGWDLMIAHPPCTHLAVSGAWKFKYKQKEQENALEFVKMLMSALIPYIAIENPIGIISTKIRKPDQIIQPYEFGHCESKRTCLWLKNLPLLKPTQFVEPKRWICKCGNIILSKNGCCGLSVRAIYDNQTKSGQNKLAPTSDRWKKRSITYKGISEAMAEQWGNYIIKNIN